MASQVFLQALVAPTQSLPNKLCFSCSPCSASTFGSRNLPLISTNSISRRCSPLIAKPTFVARADSNPDAASASDVVDEVPETDAEEVSESDAEEVSESDPEVEELKPPRQTRVKLGDVMGILHKRAIEASDEVRVTPDLRTGDIVEIRLEVPENKRRLSVYKGIVIARQNAGIHTTIRVRRIIAGTGVEITFPIYSPNIKEIKVVKHRKVRKARLYYLKHKLPRFSTFK